MRTVGVAAFLGAWAAILAQCLPAGTEAAEGPADPAGRWPAEKAWEWHNRQPWLVGCNFVPSTAVNDVEMWQKETFDPETIDRELGWAKALGFNTVRVFLNYAVWEADPDGLKQRIDHFLRIADKHGIRAMMILFDDCFKPEPKVGKQDEPVPGVHNSQWVQSPGVRRREDRAAWPMLEKYVKDVVGTFARDERIVIWDLYNEPIKSPALLERTFAWARQAHPSQPLNSCWALGEPYSDIINIHNYGPLAGLQKEVEEKRKAYGRPIICSEWMARVTGSRFETHLPYCKKEKIGCINWGLVAGRTQTYYPWGSPRGAPEPKPWLHDILRKDGIPWDSQEVSLIKEVTGRNRAAAGAATHKGWRSASLTNGLIGVSVVREIGGRIIQYRVGNKEHLWVNPQLAGKLPPPGGLGPGGSWLNWGGDKLWPAPQGWDNAEQWPGPPDAVLDGLPHKLEILGDHGPEVALRLTSGDGSPSGVRFSRVVRVFSGSTRVSVEATMTNVDTKTRRWGIWSNTQLDAARPDGKAHNPAITSYCPISPKSRFPGGYRVLFGAPDNPSFQRNGARGLVLLKYQYKVGKIAADSPAGWTATVNGTDGSVFVQRFKYEPGKEYPDGASVAFWSSGLGTIRAYGKDLAMREDPSETPFLVESELLSPFARLEPGQSYTWRYDWYATNLGANRPLVDCTEVGVVSEPLAASLAVGGKLELSGLFGVFFAGVLQAALVDGQGRGVGTVDLGQGVSPFEPVVLKTGISVAAGARSVVLRLCGLDGMVLGDLARTTIPGR